MAITNGYLTLDQFKARFVPEIDDLVDDNVLESVIESASRAIDNWLTRQRGVETQFYNTDETRYFTATFTDRAVTDDLISVTTLKTDTTGDGTYDTTLTDYRLLPTDGPPYAEIRIKPGGTSFSLIPYAVEVDGSFGFASSAPANVIEACFLIAGRVWERRNMLFGTAGPADLGTTTAESVIEQDSEIKLLLHSVAKRAMGHERRRDR